MRSFLVTILLSLLLLTTGWVVSQAQGLSSLDAKTAEALSDSQRVEQFIELALEAQNDGKVTRARTYLDQLSNFADSLDFEYARQSSLYGLGDYYLVQQKLDSAQVVLQKAEELAPGPPLDVKVKNLLATTFRYRGENQQAVKLYQQALSMIDTTSDVRTAAGISLNMGDAHMNMGATAEAFTNYNKAIAFGEQSQDSLFLATSLNNIGESHNTLGEYEEAAYYLERSLTISQEIGFKPGELRALLNLGNTRSSQSSFEEANRLYVQALDLSREIRPDTPPVRILYNLGELNARMKNFMEAEKYFRRSLEASIQQGVRQGVYYNATGLGNVKIAQNKLPEALDYYRQSLQAAEQLKNPAFLEEGHHRLYEAHKKQGEFAEALNHLERATFLSDSLNTKERERMLADYKTRLEVQRKDQINQTLEAEKARQQSQLQLQYWLIGLGSLVILLGGIFAVLLYRSNNKKKEINRELQKQKKELEEADAIKNKLLSIVAHDLRTPLSALTGMLELVREDSLEKEEMQKLFSEMEFSLLQNMDIMENLLVWAKQQMSGLQINKRGFKARQLVDQIVASHAFTAQHKDIELQNRIEPELEVFGDYDLTKLVIRNLISNSIKFSEAGDHIVIDANHKGSTVQFLIQDTGIGIPEELQGQIFKSKATSRRGTNQEKGSGLGLSLCKEFVEKQGGSISFESAEGAGTTFFITLPAVTHQENNLKNRAESTYLS